MSFLNEEILGKFSEVLESTPIFQHEYKEHYNLLCVVRDRLDTCVKYLNLHDEYPYSEEDFLSFMMFACMVTDAVKNILSEINVEYKDTDSFFKPFFIDCDLFTDKTLYTTDNKFFEYFRSLTFAHPYETSRAKFLQKGEIQYSPWVSINTFVNYFQYKENSVGVRVYTNKSDDVFTLMIPFRVLKDYISDRYEQLSEVTNWMQQDIEAIRETWKEQIIDLSLSPEKVIAQMIDILESRHIDTSDWLQRYYYYYILKLTDERNAPAVAEYLDAFTDILPLLKEKIESLDEEGLFDVFDRFEKLGRPKCDTPEHYQLEKIFADLEHRYTGQMNHDLFQAKLFAEGFASKWVIINVKSMPVVEIRLLASVACYMNYKHSEE